MVDIVVNRNAVILRPTKQTFVELLEHGGSQHTLNRLIPKTILVMALRNL